MCYWAATMLTVARRLGRRAHEPLDCRTHHPAAAAGCNTGLAKRPADRLATLVEFDGQPWFAVGEPAAGPDSRAGPGTDIQPGQLAGTLWYCTGTGPAQCADGVHYSSTGTSGEPVCL